MLSDLVDAFRRVAPAVDAWQLRLVGESARSLLVRRDVLEPVRLRRDAGAMVSVRVGDGVGYAATGELTADGLREAAQRAERWARFAGGRAIATPPWPTPRGAYRSRVVEPLASRGIDALAALLRDACRRLARDARVVERVAAVALCETETVVATGDGGRADQSFSYLVPYLSATANRGGVSQTRSLGRDGGRQGGFERLTEDAAFAAPERIADEALALLDAPECPSGSMDLVLMPSQMVLQIHESIGHPLELDRILGDERNYAGTSFVTPEMFGSYRYGSELLDVTFDPGVDGEFAAYAVDDEGSPAERQHLIRRGVLLRGLGGATSQARSGLPGVACARACAWNRPAIDRMANLNVEPGTSTLDELIRGVERGILMDSNRSWSIDDSRNKFQFGCELGRLIVDGELKGVVRNPNYRGVSSTFWRNLTGVGDAVRVAGTPNCGKGEPNQVIHVGHASPPCRFAAVDVFGGG